MNIVLPFPPPHLSPNARLHWTALSRAKQAYKDQCLVRLDSQTVPNVKDLDRIPLMITFRPPDRRRRDRDNLQHSLKYALDMLALRLGVDDYKFDPSYRFGEPVKGGLVMVTVGEPLPSPPASA